MDGQSGASPLSTKIYSIEDSCGERVCLNYSSDVRLSLRVPMVHVITGNAENLEALFAIDGGGRGATQLAVFTVLLVT